MNKIQKFFKNYGRYIFIFILVFLIYEWFGYGITYGDNFDNAKIKLEESGIDPLHTKNTKTDVMYYKQGDYSLTFFYDSETKEIVQIIYKIN